MITFHTGTLTVPKKNIIIKHISNFNNNKKVERIPAVNDLSSSYTHIVQQQQT